MTRTPETSGRPIFAVVVVVVISLAGLIGMIVGTTGQQRGMSMDLAGVVSFPMTPVSMAAFGVLVTASVFALLFGLVSVASRYDAETDRR